MSSRHTQRHPHRHCSSPHFLLSSVSAASPPLLDTRIAPTHSLAHVERTMSNERHHTDATRSAQLSSTQLSSERRMRGASGKVAIDWQRMEASVRERVREGAVDHCSLFEFDPIRSSPTVECVQHVCPSLIARSHSHTQQCEHIHTRSNEQRTTVPLQRLAQRQSMLALISNTERAKHNNTTHTRYKLGTHNRWSREKSTIDANNSTRIKRKAMSQTGAHSLIFLAVITHV